MKISMAVYRALLPLLMLMGGLASPPRDLRINPMETAQTISLNGYPSETHHVTTNDGYILEMHRIPNGKDHTPSTGRPAVFLMHGLTAASNSYILLGPDLAPAYNLADAGFDVWMGNARGNKNSRFHTTLNPDDDVEKLEFFDFSFEEIGIYDLPAMFEYILEHTGQEKLHYIGHSQGGTVFLILMSMRPEYNEKIASAHLLAGVGYQDHFPNTELATIAQFTDIIYSLAVSTGFVEYPPNSDDEQLDPRADPCSGLDKPYLCELAGIRYLMRDDSALENYEPGGGSLKQVAHYGQNIRDASFRRWSHGSIQNMVVYGTTSPPNYDLSLITANVTMHYTVSDNLLDERDVIAMANDMPNTSVRKVARDTFLHEDFVAAPDAKELVTDYIIEALREVSENAQETEEAEEENSNDNDDPLEPIIDIAVTDAAHNLALNTVFKMYLILLTISKFFK